MKTRSKEAPPTPSPSPTATGIVSIETDPVAVDPVAVQDPVVADAMIPIQEEVDSSGPRHTKKPKRRKHKKHKKKRDLCFTASQLKSSSKEVEGALPHLKLKIKLGGETFATKSVSRSSVTDAVLTEQELLQSEDDVDDYDDEGEVEEEEQQQQQEEQHQEEQHQEEQQQHEEQHKQEEQQEDEENKGMEDEDALEGNMEEGEVALLISGTEIIEEDDEEAWLEALEAGDLNEHGELKKEKDVNLLTTRQKAILQMKADHQEQLWELPLSAQPESELTEEMIRKRAVRAQRRRDQAQKKDLENKKQTIERLLKKQEVKSKMFKSGKLKKNAEGTPQVRYINSLTGFSLSYPDGFEFPMSKSTAKTPPMAIPCGVEGCKNLKKYSCSKTGVPLCSLECYKKNQRLTEIPAI